MKKNYTWKLIVSVIDETCDIISRDSRASHCSFRRASLLDLQGIVHGEFIAWLPLATNNLGSLVATSAARNVIPTMSQARFPRFCDFAILLDGTKNWRKLAKKFAINCRNYRPLIGDISPATFPIRSSVFLDRHFVEDDCE